LTELGLHFPDTWHVQLISEVKNGKFNFIFYADVMYFLHWQI